MRKRRFDASAWSQFPISQEPVKEMAFKEGASISALPRVPPAPATRFTTPFGIPALWHASTMRQALSGAAEAGFITAAVDRLIPQDETGPSASEAGVPSFLDHQLAGPYGRGDHYYLAGPWSSDATESQGYQSRYTPAEFYRHAIAEIEAYVVNANLGQSFKDLSANEQDKLLKQMESGDLKLDGPITSKAFFTMFLQNVLEGYFSDPIYGGNKGGAAWKMIGFPGAHYDYSEWVTAYNRPVPVEMVGLRGRPGWQRG